jgi:uncharacterized membrane protein
MPETAREVVDLIVRWVHVIAAIMWIGNSLLFNWLDRTLIPRSGTGKAGPGVIGDTWLLHSGAFYFVEKTLLGSAGQTGTVALPSPLHWFKWQSYTTWMSGVSLLVIVYYLGGRAVLVSPDAGISTAMAVTIGLGVLLAAWLVYDYALAPALGSAPVIGAAAAFIAVVATTWGLDQILAPRAVFLHVGAMMATLMSGNVFRHIVPSQRQMVDAAARGEPPDPALSLRAKRRSIHNNYITFPVLALMVSNHFPTLYGHPYNWLVLGAIVLAGAGARHWLNVRFTFAAWRPALAATIAVGALSFWLLARWQPSSAGDTAASGADGGTTGAEPVSFAEARHIIDRRCGACHSTAPSDEVYRVAPLGIMFDTPEQIRSQAARIAVRAVETRTMPLGNKTHMTEAERAALGVWIRAGAPE